MLETMEASILNSTSRLNTSLLSCAKERNNDSRSSDDTLVAARLTGSSSSGLENESRSSGKGRED
jgi:hypothetical protein